MLAYTLRRILLIVPTLFAIILVNFVIMQAAPGGPVDQMIAELRGTQGSGLGQVGGGGGELRSTATSANQNRGARGLNPDFIKQLNKLYGFDKPAPERFWIMLKDYLRFDFGTSFYQGQPVIRLIAREAAGVDLARPVDDASHLSHLDPARHPQSGEGRQRLRCLDERRDRRRLCHPGLPFCRAADRALRRRQVFRLVPAARPRLRRLGDLLACCIRSSIISGTSRCRCCRW